MERGQLNVFADPDLDHDTQLALVRDLRRLYDDLAAEPIPPHLQPYVDRLGEALDRAGTHHGKAPLAANAVR